MLIFVTLINFLQLTSSNLSSRIIVDRDLINNVKLELIDLSKNYHYFTVVDKNGYFDFSDLDVGGNYELTVKTVGETKHIKVGQLRLGNNEIKQITF